MASAELIAERFRERFGVRPAVIASAPGRVNLIGEHTDYNDGFVLPIAIDRRAYVAMSARDDTLSLVASTEFGEAVELASSDCDAPGGAWHDAARGVLCEFAKIERDPSPAASPACSLAMPHQPHANVLISSDVPRGAGLSSSAAVEMAIARALCGLEGVAWVPLQFARLGQRVEHHYMGVRSGIMDQLVAAGATTDAAMRIDCRTLDVTRARIPRALAIVVMDTGTRRTLGDGEYNERRAACDAAVAALGKRRAGIRALRDATLDDLDSAPLTDVERRRARHVITENERVDRFIRELEAGDFAAAGRAMNESHASLRDDYGVSSTHLDVICELARSDGDCFGARLTGAGFGGCAIALVRGEHVARFIAAVQPRYEAATYMKSDFFPVRPSPGARLEDVR